MTDEHESDDSSDDQVGASWDPLDVLRARAEASRSQRDEAISSLRESMTDDEIREDFGIDLHEIEG